MNTPLTDAKITEIAASGWPESRKLAALQVHANELEESRDRLLRENATVRAHRIELTETCVVLRGERDKAQRELSTERANLAHADEKIAELQGFIASDTAARDAERKKASHWHRRAQQAEAACVRFKKEWDKHGGPCGGNFGRAMLAAGWRGLQDRLDWIVDLLGARYNAATIKDEKHEVAAALKEVLELIIQKEEA